MTEPDVALTDYALAIECTILALLLRHLGAPKGGLRVPFLLFFGSISATALFGGTVHGFFLDVSSLGHAILWPAALLGVGVTATAAWILGARLWFSKGGARWIAIAAVLGLAVYAALVLSGSQSFRVAVLFYVPATVFLALAYIYLLGRTPGRAATMGLSGLGLSFVAAFIQQAGVSIHPIFFTHNALYHLVQGIALFMIFLSARGLLLGERRGAWRG